MAGASENAADRRNRTGLTPARSALPRPLALAFAPVLCAAETLKGTCIRAPAADRLEVWLGQDDGIVTVRLAGIDADSLREGFQRYATLFTRNRAVGKPVTVEVHSRSTGGEVTGRVIVDHVDLSYLIVSEGLARTSGAAPKGMRLPVAEESARVMGPGACGPMTLGRSRGKGPRSTSGTSPGRSIAAGPTTRGRATA